MAIDTATKRASALNPGCPWRGMLPLPATGIDAGDRMQVVFLYRGILAAAAAIATLVCARIQIRPALEASPDLYPAIEGTVQLRKCT